MRYASLMFVAFLLLAGCGQKKTGSDQTGSASQAGYADVIDEKIGYIVENAQFTAAEAQPDFTLDGGIRLSKGTTSVLIVRGRTEDGRGATVLAMQFASFSPGSALEFDGAPGKAQFWISGTVNGATNAMQTGLISGSLRFTKKEAAPKNFGLNRNVMQGLGTMEISVANIQSGAFKMPASKGFNAQYKLPIITLAELATMNTAS